MWFCDKCAHVVQCVSFRPVLHKQINQLTELIVISLMKSISLMNIKSRVWFCRTVRCYATVKSCLKPDKLSIRWCWAGGLCQGLTHLFEERWTKAAPSYSILESSLAWIQPCESKNWTPLNQTLFIHISNISYWMILVFFSMYGNRWYLIVSVYSF